MRAYTCWWLGLAACFVLSGCPQREQPAATPPAAPSAQASPQADAAAGTDASPGQPETQAPDNADPAARLNPTENIPADEPLTAYAGLKLGMDSVAMARIYPAPEGRGDGYARVIQDFGDVRHHIISFDVKDGEPERRIVASFYRDELYLIVDRRDGINAAQLKAWHDQCLKDYGADCRETIAGAQWTWLGQGGVSLAFTQDNSAPDYMDAHVIIAHAPTQAAAHAYLELREQHEQDTAHPEGSTTR